MPISFPVSLPPTLAMSWQLPDVVVIWAFTLVLGLGHVLFLATVIQLLRRRRFAFLLAALATYAWALGVWSSTADSVGPVRAALGGHQTFVSLNVAAQAIFIGLTLIVIVAAWRRVRAARAAGGLPAMATPAIPPTVAPAPVAAVASPAPLPAAPEVPDVDAWLR